MRRPTPHPIPAVSSFDGEHRFLSNFWPAEVLLDSEVYSTVEHAYQAAKTTDETLRAPFLAAARKTASWAKSAGRKLPLRNGWDEMRVRVMALLLAQKFASGKPLARQLLETRNAPLVEGNAWGDRFWGVCDGEGENTLGVLLMLQRRALRSTCLMSTYLSEHPHPIRMGVCGQPSTHAHVSGGFGMCAECATVNEFAVSLDGYEPPMGDE